ncbi:hypothetical protein J3L16_15845, partial [Alteromonas sp. 5E99-2]|uniref:condensation domain-containing protein n=1 Tax=Alteromonas sp. 5E99-2 TaxID=2817683 RepID=UPI001AD30342
DGWSLNIFIEELIALYVGFVEGEAPSLAELPIQFSDYAIWQRSWLGAGEMDRQLAYWQDTLGEEHTALALPYDYSKQSHVSAVAQQARFAFTPSQTQAIKGFASEHQSTLYMVMLALLKLTLYRVTDTHDLRIGSPIANRSRVETQGLIGYLMNVQVLRTELQSSAGFSALLHQVKETVLASQVNADVPFDMLVDALKPERISGVHPLFQVKCTQQNTQELNKTYHFAGLSMSLTGL